MVYPDDPRPRHPQAFKAPALEAGPLIGHRVLVDVLPVWVWSDYI